MTDTDDNLTRFSPTGEELYDPESEHLPTNENDIKIKRYHVRYAHSSVTLILRKKNRKLIGEKVQLVLHLVRDKKKVLFVLPRVILKELGEVWADLLKTQSTSNPHQEIVLRSYGGLDPFADHSDFDACITFSEWRWSQYAIRQKLLKKLGVLHPDMELELVVDEVTRLALLEIAKVHKRLNIAQRNTDCTLIHFGKLKPKGWTRFTCHTTSALEIKAQIRSEQLAEARRLHNLIKAHLGFTTDRVAITLGIKPDRYTEVIYKLRMNQEILKRLQNFVKDNRLE